MTQVLYLMSQASIAIAEKSVSIQFELIFQQQLRKPT
jgi:hypothetical protein